MIKIEKVDETFSPSLGVAAALSPLSRTISYRWSRAPVVLNLKPEKPSDINKVLIALTVG